MASKPFYKSRLRHSQHEWANGGGFRIMQVTQALTMYLPHRADQLHGRGQIQNEQKLLMEFAMSVQNIRMRDISPVQVDNFTSWIKATGITNNTFVRKINTLKQFFIWVREEIKYPGPDPEYLSKEYFKFDMPRIATDEDFDKIMAAIPDNNEYHHIRMRAFIAVQGDCGARINEMLSLNLSDLYEDLKNACVQTEKSKYARAHRRLMWDEEARDCLIDWLDRRAEILKTRDCSDPDALFLSSPRGQQSGVWARTKMETVIYWFRKYSLWAGLPYVVNPHSLRHRRLRQNAIDGMPLPILQQFAGHKDVNSTRVYYDLWSAELREQYDKYKPVRRPEPEFAKKYVAS